MGWHRLNFSGSGHGQAESSFGCSNEPPGSITFWETISGYTTGGLSSSAELHRES
jgi:hypothetical protein